MRAFFLLLVCALFACADFSTTCNTGCVTNATWWQANTASWPSSCALQLSTQICSTNVSAILAAYTSDTLAAPDVLVEWIAAKANVCAGACTTVTASNAISNLQGDIDEANAGTSPTTYTSAGCTSGLATYKSQLNTNSLPKALGKTLYRYNNGINYGPCACGSPGCAAVH